MSLGINSLVFCFDCPEHFKFLTFNYRSLYYHIITLLHCFYYTYHTELLVIFLFSRVDFGFCISAI